MSSEAGIKFDINLLESFFDNLAIFTPGSLVLLSNGFYAIVTSISSGLPFHPTIKVIAKPNKEFLKEELYIDLKEYDNIKVLRNLSENETIAILNSTQALNTSAMI